MKKLFLFTAAAFVYSSPFAQNKKIKYPEPEFANEIYLLKKDSSVLKLEKDDSRLDTKVKMAGFAGVEHSYTIEGKKSPVRLNWGDSLSFVFSTGASAKKSSASSDSIMIANGMDPTMMSGIMGGMSDPANTISLYKAESVKGIRKIFLQKTAGCLAAINRRLIKSIHIA